jgi:hypothetical protein
LFILFSDRDCSFNAVAPDGIPVMGYRQQLDTPNYARSKLDCGGHCCQWSCDLFQYNRETKTCWLYVTDGANTNHVTCDGNAHACYTPA